MRELDIIDRVKKFHIKRISRENATATLIAQYRYEKLIATARYLLPGSIAPDRASDAASIIVETVYNAHSEEIETGIRTALARLEASPGVSFSFDELVYPEVG